MRLRRNIELAELYCSNSKCTEGGEEPVAYVKRSSTFEMRCPECKKPLSRGLLFAASMMVTRAMTTVVAKSESQPVP